MKLLILIIISLLNLINHIKSIPVEVSQSNSGTSNFVTVDQIDSNCACNIMQNQCDKYCCCDGDCSGAQQSFWDSQNKCIDLAYPSFLVIPECNDSSLYNIDDLFRVFRIAYNIFRELMCLKDNNLNSDKLKSEFLDLEISSENQDKIEDIITSLKSSTVVGSQDISQISYIDQSSFLEDLQVFKTNDDTDILYLYQQEPSSLSCKTTPFYIFNSMSPTDYCFYQIPANSVSNSLVLSNIDKTFTIDYWLETTKLFYKNVEILTEVSLNINGLAQAAEDATLDYSTSSFLGPLSATQVALLDAKFSTDCTAENTCKNVVVQKHFTIQFAGGSNTKIDEIKLELYLQDLPYSTNEILNIPQINFVTFNRTDQYNNYSYQTSGLFGYQMGLPLRMGEYILSGGNDAILEYVNPLQLGYQTNEGECTFSTTGSTSDENIDSISTYNEIKFGYDQVFSCTIPESKKSTNWCQSGLYTNLFMYMKYIARFGDSNPNYIQDWIKITTTCQNNAYPIINIAYSKFGKMNNIVYVVNGITVQWQSATTNGNSRLLKAFIQFQLVEQDTNFFQASLPKVRAYLPNDWLYPFYVAQSSIIVYQTLLFALLAILIAL